MCRNVWVRVCVCVCACVRVCVCVCVCVMRELRIAHLLGTNPANPSNRIRHVVNSPPTHNTLLTILTRLFWGDPSGYSQPPPLRPKKANTLPHSLCHSHTERTQVMETRMTGLLIHLCVGLALSAVSVLKLIPMAVLLGLFLTMGVTSLSSVQAQLPIRLPIQVPIQRFGSQFSSQF